MLIGRRKYWIRALWITLLVAWGLLTWRSLYPPLVVQVPPFTAENMVRCSGGSGASEFLIDQFEVTEGDYASFLAVHPSVPAPVHWEGRRRPLPKHDHLPVVRITKLQAEQYAAWKKKRLPTLAEWRWAALGSFGLLPWGADTLEIRANTMEAGLGARTPVGLFPSGASPFGAYDMVGNVREWTVTRTSAEGDRVITVGGSFREPLNGILDLRTERRIEEFDVETEQWIEVALPDGFVPGRPELENAWSDDLGFRCVMDAGSARANEDPGEGANGSGASGARRSDLPTEAKERANYDRIAGWVSQLGGRDPWTILTRTWPAERRLREEGAAALRPLQLALYAASDERVRERVSKLISEIESETSVRSDSEQ